MIAHEVTLDREVLIRGLIRGLEFSVENGEPAAVQAKVEATIRSASALMDDDTLDRWYHDLIKGLSVEAQNFAKTEVPRAPGALRSSRNTTIS